MADAWQYICPKKCLMNYDKNKKKEPFIFSAEIVCPFYPWLIRKKVRSPQGGLWKSIDSKTTQQTGSSTKGCSYAKAGINFLQKSRTTYGLHRRIHMKLVQEKKFVEL